MSEKTKIEWCDASWSPWLGCRKVSPGCANCYITRTAPLRTRGIKHGGERQRTSAGYWKVPLRGNRNEAELCKCGKSKASALHDCEFGRYDRDYEEKMRRMSVFPSLCDWLDPEVPSEWLADFLGLIHDTPNLDWLLLTKRPQLWRQRLESALQWMTQMKWDEPSAIMVEDWLWGHGLAEPPANVWIGTSVEDQERADERIPELLKIPAKVRFVSAEPLLGAIDLDPWLVRPKNHRVNPARVIDGIPQIDWMIVGGESGPGARPCNVEWVRDIVWQCKRAGVPCFVKQLGSKPVTTHFEHTLTCDNDDCVLSGNPGDCDGVVMDYLVPIKDSKGGAPSEWPEDLRVRERLGSSLNAVKSCKVL